MTLPRINIHLTDYCNQNCSFCFAREEMKKNNNKQIDIIDFKRLIKNIKKTKIYELNLLGGEPTLHDKFSDLLEYSTKKFLLVRVYSNGIFNREVKNLFRKKQKNVGLIINVSTPGFLLNRDIRNQVINNIQDLMLYIPVTLSIISSFIKYKEVVRILNFVNKEIIKNVGILLNFQKPIYGEKNTIKLDDFPKVGKGLNKIIDHLFKLGLPKNVEFSEGLTHCMFTDQQKMNIKNKGLKIVFDRALNTCRLGQKEDTAFHITSNLTTFNCYPLSMIDNYQISEKTKIEDIQCKYQEQKKYKFDYILPKCFKCVYFGFENGKCSGPCPAFRMNLLKKNKLSD